MPSKSRKGKPPPARSTPPRNEPGGSYWNSVGFTGGNWREVYRKLGAEILEDGYVRPLMDRRTLLVTNCSRTKGTEGDRAVPRKFYLGPGPQRLMDFGDRHKLDWAILSDLYGIHYRDEKLKFYDVAPGQVADPVRLGELIGKRAAERGYERIVYHCTSPLRARPYIRFLSNSGLKFVYTTSLTDRKPAKGFF